MYVPRSLSLRTARRFRYAHVWETAAYEHSGISEDGPRILRTLFAGLAHQQRLRARGTQGGIHRTLRVRAAAAVVTAAVAVVCMK